MNFTRILAFFALKTSAVFDTTNLYASPFVYVSSRCEKFVPGTGFRSALGEIEKSGYFTGMNGDIFLGVSMVMGDPPRCCLYWEIPKMVDDWG